jgi:hypothetical protein
MVIDRGLGFKPRERSVMAYSLNHNTTVDTGDPDVTISFHSADTDDFAVKSVAPDSFTMTNMVSPIAFPENVEIAMNKINNVYANAGIDPTFYTPTKRGTSIRVQLRETWTYADSADPSKPMYAMPVSASLHLRVPNNDIISLSDIRDLFKRLLACTYTDGSDHWAEWFRGSLILK